MDRSRKRAHPSGPRSSIAVDSIGIGAGVFDQLINQEVQGLRPINVGSAPLNPELLANLRAELYWNLRERLRTGSIALTNDEQLAEELAAIRYRFNRRVVAARSRSNPRTR